jgi:hypothetical protein
MRHNLVDDAGDMITLHNTALLKATFPDAHIRTLRGLVFHASRSRVCHQSVITTALMEPTRRQMKRMMAMMIMRKRRFIQPNIPFYFVFMTDIKIYVCVSTYNLLLWLLSPQPEMY